MKASHIFQMIRSGVHEMLLLASFWVLTVTTPMTVMGQSIYATPYTMTTLAGLPGVSGTNDGTGSAARFF
jgi:hypothetical protein